MAGGRDQVEENNKLKAQKDHEREMNDRARLAFVSQYMTQINPDVTIFTPVEGRAEDYYVGTLDPTAVGGLASITGVKTMFPDGLYESNLTHHLYEIKNNTISMVVPPATAEARLKAYKELIDLAICGKGSKEIIFGWEKPEYADLEEFKKVLAYAADKGVTVRLNKKTEDFLKSDKPLKTDKSKKPRKEDQILARIKEWSNAIANANTEALTKQDSPSVKGATQKREYLHRIQELEKLEEAPLPPANLRDSIYGALEPTDKKIELIKKELEDLQKRSSLMEWMVNDLIKEKDHLEAELAKPVPGRDDELLQALLVDNEVQRRDLFTQLTAKAADLGERHRVWNEEINSLRSAAPTTSDQKRELQSMAVTTRMEGLKLAEFNGPKIAALQNSMNTAQATFAGLAPAPAPAPGGGVPGARP